VKRAELERELARLASDAESSRSRLDEMHREVAEIQAVLDELVTSLSPASPSANAGDNVTRDVTPDTEVAQPEVV
jgi:uncharacterized coiled-coil DUF342 family protein